jgi:diguanylate cyclase (GGDEF)-like protein
MRAVVEKPLVRNKALLEETLGVLLQCRYFQNMSADLLREVLRKGTHLDVPATTVLIRESDLNDDLFFLLNGSLRVVSAQKLVLRYSDPGDVVGELAVLSDQPRSADVIAETDSRLVRVSSSLVKTTLTDPARAVQFLTMFAHIMAAKLRETTRRARLYEDSVLEAQEMASSQTRLESEIAERLQEVLLYSKVVESSSEAMLITSPDGTVERFNPAAERLFPALSRKRGKTPLNLQDLVKPFSKPGFPAEGLAKPWRGEWVREREGEERLILQVTVTPIVVQEDKPLDLAYQIHDITLQKAQERAIARQNEEIQRTLSDLESTFQELQRSDRLKTETLAVISAELSAPIRKVINHAAKLSQSIGELSREQAAQELTAIQEQGEYLKVVAENIGNLIELQADFQGTGAQTLVAQDLFAQLKEDLGFWAGRKHVTIETRLPEEPLTLVANAEQIKVALNLLVEQALMVTQPHTVLVIGGELIPGSNQVHLDVKYQGPGLHQLAPNQGGQGRMGLLIGLPLARKVISQHQGSLQFLSDGETARISVLLPRTQKEGEERPNRVMIFDAEDMDRLIVRGVIEHLWPDSVLLLSHDPFEFLDGYEDFKPDLVILDPEIYQPGWANHRLVAALVQNRRHLCPIFALSGLYNDFAERTIAVERGVTDFLAKPYSIFDLRFKVKSLLQAQRKEETLHQTMDLAQRQAFTDGLTRLANRKHLDGFLETQINYSRQTRKPCSLIMIDIDNFKHYNDANGHQLGDEVLKGVARILAKSVRSSDLAARYGGEEFCLVLPETRKDMAAVIAEKVRRSIQETAFPRGDKQPMGFVSASFGVATLDEDANSSEALIKAADESLYKAKEQGRNRVVKAAGRAAAEPGEAVPPAAVKSSA